MDMKTGQQTVGIFHRDECNRKVLIKLLSSEFECVEIEKWEDVSTSNVHTIIIGSPELWFPEISFDEMKEQIEKVNANVLMLNSDERLWWIFRANYVQLRNPTEELVKMKLRELHPDNGRIKRFRKQGLRV